MRGCKFYRYKNKTALLIQVMFNSRSVINFRQKRSIVCSKEYPAFNRFTSLGSSVPSIYVSVEIIPWRTMNGEIFRFIITVFSNLHFWR